MTGKQRFEAVMDYQKPDKLPLYIPTVACTVASEILGRNAVTGADSLHFAEELALCQGKDAYEDFEGRFYQDSADLYRALRVDVVRVTWRANSKASKQLDDYTLLFGDENGEHYIKRFYPEPQTYGVVHDARKPKSPEELLEIYTKALEKPEYVPTAEDAIASIQKSVRIFDSHKGEELGEILPGGGFGIGMTDPILLELALMEPEVLRETYMRAARYEIARMKHLVKLGYRFFNGGIDMASNQGPIYSPKTFREVMVEPLALFAEACKKEKAIFCYRSDGNMWPVFDMMFGECGVQAFGEVDRDATMTVEAIRKQGPNVIILGNMSSAFLHRATEAEVRVETRKQLEESGGTHFIPGPSNAVMPGTPVKNLFAMVEEIEKF